MNEETTREKKLLEFYNAMVNKSQVDTNSLEIFFLQAIMCMLMGWEFKDRYLANSSTYELLFMVNLSINGKYIDLQEIISPFEMIDDGTYYIRILNNHKVLNKVVFFENLFTKLNEGNGEDILHRLGIENASFMNSFKEIVKLREIYRRGWIDRNVEKKYVENDALHTAQMFGLASAYLTLYKPYDIDKQKVLEMILIHEIGEVLVGDISERDIRHANKHVSEERCVREIFSKFTCGERFINLWLEFEDRKSNEARFVYELDKLDPVLKAKYLDECLNRNDLYRDFYDYEDRRGTFQNGYLKKVFKMVDRKEE